MNYLNGTIQIYLYVVKKKIYEPVNQAYRHLNIVIPGHFGWDDCNSLWHTVRLIKGHQR